MFLFVIGFGLQVQSLEIGLKLLRQLSQIPLGTAIFGRVILIPEELPWICQEDQATPEKPVY
jgi:hypothetical protein